MRRLLAPRSIAVVGGDAAAEAIRQCRRVGYTGAVWAVHPRRAHIEGVPCVPTVDDLPGVPDAVLLAVPPAAAVEVAGRLSRMGAGGIVCHTSGFAEAGEEGAGLQRALLDAAGDTVVIGPNCNGVLNYADGVALWPDQHGGERVDRGVAIVSQSGNIGLNFTMQRRSVPITHVVSLGNGAGAGLADVVDALLDDDRVDAIGLHIEGIGDVAAFSRAALRALERGVPLAVLKSGASELGALATLSHTSSLAGPDELSDALFRRLGIARTPDPAGLLETLKLLAVHGGLAAAEVASASCSGGEASLVADLAEPRGLRMPPLPGPVRERLEGVLGPHVPVANPLDYHGYIWGDLAAQTACFAAFLGSGAAAHLLVLDFPRPDVCGTDHWRTTLDAFIAAHRAHPVPACVVSSLPEGLPESVRGEILAAGIAPMQGIAECLDAVRAAAEVGAAQRRARAGPPAPPGPPPAATRRLDEWESKRALAAHGVAVPAGRLVADGAGAAAAAADLGYPVVLKAVAAHLAHKTEAGAVRVDLRTPDDLAAALESMRGLGDRFLVERMAGGAVAELIVGVRWDPVFGAALTVGAGGTLVELLRDSATSLLPVSRDDIGASLRSLRTWPLLAGYRGRPAGDVAAAVEAIAAVADLAAADADRVTEIDLNPLLVLPEGAVAVDAVVTVRAGAAVGTAEPDTEEDGDG
ncbi:acetate--CoA ligase family protein [Murinocardiopsis flavida]|nr:acetate--CoA ligase family protein [Murinocardiopsis flavida]